MSRFRSFLLIVGLSLFFAPLLSCDRKLEPARDPIGSEPFPTQLDKPKSNALVSSAGTETSSTPSVAELIGAYLTAKEYTARMELAYRISARNTEEALRALGNLFQRETDADLKEDLLDAISKIKSLDTPQVLAIGLDPAQPREVRMAAIDELRFFGDPVAIPLLEPLLEDPDPRIREMARKSIDSLKTPRISGEHKKRILEGLRKKPEGDTQSK